MTLNLLADIAFYGAMGVVWGVPLIGLTVAVVCAWRPLGNRGPRALVWSAGTRMHASAPRQRAPLGHGRESR